VAGWDVWGRSGDLSLSIVQFIVPRGYKGYSRDVCDDAWSREMGPDVPSMRDTRRCEVEACRMDIVNPPNRLICSR
jgi:hypothetical protein